jgi:hypothetical protein
MRRSSLVAVVAACVLAVTVGTAAAGPPGTTPPAKKSNAPAAASVISGAVVLVGALTVFGGAFPSCLDDCPMNEEQMLVGGVILLLGPTLVRLPAREAGALHLGIRIAGAAVIAGNVMAYNRDDGPYLIGATLVFAGAISDVVTVHGAYRRWNERRAMSIAPVSVAPSGTLVPGLSLSGRF